MVLLPLPTTAVVFTITDRIGVVVIAVIVVVVAVVVVVVLVLVLIVDDAVVVFRTGAATAVDLILPCFCLDLA